MKSNKILIIAIVVLLVVAVFVYIQRKKKAPDKNVLDKILSNLFGSKKTKGVTETLSGYKITESPDYKFFQSQGYGDTYLSMFSQADLATMRNYIENYTRKGIKIQPSDPIYKDVIRINSYAKMFNDLPNTF